MKCGTKTMAEAFRILGYKVCDFHETGLDCGDAWLDFFNPENDAEAKKTILFDMLKDYDIVFDRPAFMYWKELLEVYPEAKCIFFERDEQEWYESYKNITDMHAEVGLISDMVLSKKYPCWFTRLFVRFFHPKLLKVYVLHDKMEPLTVGESCFHFRNWYGKRVVHSEINIRRAYRQHNADFVRNCPKNRRLILPEIGCGWKFLCDFLGCDQPMNIEFPHENKGGSLARKTVGKVAQYKRDAIRDRLIGMVGFGLLCGYFGRKFLR